MNPAASSVVALRSRNQAHDYFQNGNVGRAFAHFLVALQLKPEWKNDLKKEFSSTLCTWGEQLETNQRFKDLFNCYEQAIEIFPENECVLCNLGSHLFRLGHLREAAHYFRQALDINHDYLPAYRNLQSVCNALVERWHFRMLNDTYRNEAYREAILKKVRQGFSSVLDIGSGTGILSLYAVSAGAKDVHACDYSPTMCYIAQGVLEANKMVGKITVINKLSNNLNIPDDLPHRKSLVVTETMDAGLLGEHLLETLLHAWDYLLKPPCPELVTVLDTEVSLAQYGVVVPFGAKLWAAPIQSRSIARRNYLLDDSTRSWNFNIMLYSDSSEPYDTENLRLNTCKFLSDPVEVFCYDFNNPKELKEYYEGRYDGKSVSFEFEGKSDALAVWFDVLLDEDITITSSPFSEDPCCWDQAIFRFQEPQDSFLAKISCSGGKLKFELNQQDNINQLLTNSRTSSSADRSEYKFSVSSEAILFLNNKQLQDSIFVLAEFCDKVENVLELSPFPMLGLQFVRLKQSNLFCVLKTEEEVKAVMEFIRNNNIDSAKVKCLKINELDDILSNIGDKFDFIFNSLFEASGELKEYNINRIPKLMEVLNPGGALAPTSLKVMCRLTNCPGITRTTKVINEELIQKYNIAPFINVYQVSQQLDIDLQSIDCEYLSDSVSCLQITQKDLAADSCRIEDISVPVVKDGCINALPLWYQYQLMPNQEYLSTAEADSHVNQIVYIVEPPYQVQAGDVAVVNVTLHSGIIRLK